MGGAYGKYLEEFAAAYTIFFVKTGTLTNAQPTLETVIPFGGYSENEVLKISACLEEHFPHSVARAIVKGAADLGIDHAEVNYIVAHGIATTLKGERAIIGSRHFVCEDEGFGNVVMLTGDSEKAARFISKQLGITEYHRFCRRKSTV